MLREAGIQVEFDHYEEAPQPVAEKVIAEHQAAKAAE